MTDGQLHTERLLWPLTGLDVYRNALLYALCFIAALNSVLLLSALSAVAVLLCCCDDQCV
jgi:hypothetical protein